MKTRCTPECVSPTPAQAHCSVCHQTFGGVTLFDRHRLDGKCLAPSSLGMTRMESGVWRVPMDPEARARLVAARKP